MRLRIVACALATGLLMAANVFAQEQGTRPNTAPPAGQSTPTQKSMRIRVGGNVQQAMRLYQILPTYPDDAKAAHISGTVMLHIVVATDGSVLSLDVISGPPELTKSAMDAVKQWRYRPTLLKHKPVEVDTTVSVNYRLGAPPASEHGTETTPAQPTEGAQMLSPAPTQAPIRIRVGAKEQAAKLIHQAFPVYPDEAKQDRIGGTVMFHAIIAKDGSVLSLEVISGLPLLVNSAMDAVLQWRYKPTTFNGEPVEVDTTISVIFTLGG